MGRLLFLAMVAVVAYWLLRRLMNQGRNSSAPAERQTVEDTSSDTVRCSVCGIYVPRSEALMTKGQYYCDTHRPDHLK